MYTLGLVSRRHYVIHLSDVLSDGATCSRNQLSVIPAFIARLELLQVLLINNNRLVSLPEEIRQLGQLMQLVCMLYV